MARIKFGSIVTEGRGSLGGHTFQNSSGGVQLRTKPINNKKPSSAQSLIRSYNPHLQAGWRSLTDAQRDIWSRFATSHQICMLRDPDRPVCGHSLYMKYNFEYISRGLSLIASPYLMGPPYIGADIIKNGTFDSSANWTVSGNFVISGGNVTYTPGAVSRLYQTQLLSSGGLYRVSFDISNCATTSALQLFREDANYPFDGGLTGLTVISNGSFSFDSNLVLNTTQLRFYVSAARAIFSLDNFSVRRLYY